MSEYTAGALYFVLPASCPSIEVAGFRKPECFAEIAFRGLCASDRRRQRIVIRPLHSLRKSSAKLSTDFLLEIFSALASPNVMESLRGPTSQRRREIKSVNLRPASYSTLVFSPRRRLAQHETCIRWVLDFRMDRSTTALHSSQFLGCLACPLRHQRKRKRHGDHGSQDSGRSR